ncbi:hypothetical protein QQM39_26775 [Streptomyces sp. DT2A-34]|uniref:hypothetical protein n=1 Tax=Streptomyces sp. DT2A-34 TaxID=3051182 RepID=UPI00265C6BE7|nr:hypothetical protein [Streptomyces sp. DT2A-34]MDO0914302.1 hypothetical protein [Streptomyces sp. DT2A-34]
MVPRPNILDGRAYTAQRVTYDLSIEGLHTYHVAAGESDVVLVHNDDGEACPISAATSPGSMKWPNFRNTKTLA